MSLRLGDDFGEARVFAQRIPEWVELEVCNREAGRDFEEMRQRRDGRVEIAEARLNLCQCGQSPRLVHPIHIIVFDGTLRLLQSFCLFSKPGISEGESTRCAVRVWRNGRIRLRFNRFDRARETATRILIAAGPLLTKAEMDQSELDNSVERLSRWK